MNDGQAVELVRATVHGQRDLHLVIKGQTITLCGYVGDYPHRWQPERDTCGVCIRIAERDGLVIPC